MSRHLESRLDALHEPPAPGVDRPAPGKSTLTSRLAPRPGAPPSAGNDNGAPTEAPPAPGDDPFGVHLLGAGQPLDAGARAFAERGFGRDLGHVRIHTGAEAAASAAGQGAHAYALGNDVVFGAGQYQPDTPAGRWLLAHELAHVVQQDGQPSAPMHHGDGGSTATSELAADTAADRVVAGETGVATSLAAAPRRPSFFKGPLPWGPLGEYEMWGSVNGLPILHERGTRYPVAAGSDGELTIILRGEYRSRAGTGVLQNMALGKFSVVQSFPYRCTPEGVLTVDKDAMLITGLVNDPSHMNPFGIAEAEMSVVGNPQSDGKSFIMEVITFSPGAASLGVSYHGVGVGTAAGGTKGTHPIGVRVDLDVLGAKESKPTPTPPTPTPAPPRKPQRLVHTIEFAQEKQTKADPGEIVRWATALDPHVATDISSGRRVATVVGYASTTGTEQENFEHYAAERARWARQVLARALPVDESAIKLGWRGSYTAPAHQQPPPGVPDKHERRVEIAIDEVTPAGGP